MNWRRLNRGLHRDLGYLCFGLTIVYAVSGVLVNHLHEWNPNYEIRRSVSRVDPSVLVRDDDLAKRVLRQLGEDGAVQSSFRPDPDTLQVFVEGSSITVNLATGEVEQERAAERPVLRELNYLHLNHPKRLWTWVADLYAVALAAVAVTGLLILRGRHGLRGRGGWLTAVGIALPLLFLVLYKWFPSSPEPFQGESGAHREAPYIPGRGAGGRSGR